MKFRNTKSYTIKYKKKLLLILFEIEFSIIENLLEI